MIRLRLFALACFLAVTLSVQAQVDVALEPLAQGPQNPTGIYSAYDGSGRLFIISRSGSVSIYDRHTDDVLATPFLDISALVDSSDLELGLLGLAFHPEYESNGLFYVMYTNLASDSTLAQFSVSADPNVADASSATVLLVIDQPDNNHNISQILFGPDGYLYIGAGDGGSAGDPGNRAQDLGELLGKILRIDVDGAFPYAIPADNPFVGVAGARPEIWAYGVRNPWRFTFDRATGDIFIGDVGQFAWEEVSFQAADSVGGENYGWRLMEGAHCFNPAQNCNDGTLVLPIFEYPQAQGRCAVIGGYRYRGSRFPSLQGLYFSADWCTGEIWALDETAPGNWQSEVVHDAPFLLTTFGEDEDGELYVADSSSGIIYRLVGTDPYCDVEMSQPTYGNGETWTITSARLSNMGSAPLPTRFRLGLVPPGSPPIFLVDIGADGSFALPPGFDIDLGPIPLLTVGPGTPRATFSSVCVLSDPTLGTVQSIDFETFEVVE